MKKILCFLLAVTVSICVSLTAEAAVKEELTAKIEACKSNKEIAHEMAECARALGYPEDSIIIQEAQARWWAEHKSQQEYQRQLDAAPKEYPYDYLNEEYPYAVMVWDILDAKGYNDHVKAGILGNMMAETSHDSLALDPFVYGSDDRYTYYGLCQWGLTWTPEVAGEDIPSQLEILHDTMPENMKYWGGDYTYFCALQDERAAAKYFNSYYERGIADELRADNAAEAYKYFMGRNK